MKRKWHKLGQGGLLPPYILADFSIVALFTIALWSNFWIVLTWKEKCKNFLNLIWDTLLRLVVSEKSQRKYLIILNNDALALILDHN